MIDVGHTMETVRGAEADRKLVTIVIPAFNEALKIMSTLTSVYTYMQSLEQYRFELLVIDDGSTDETGEIVAAFGRTRPEVRLIRQPSNLRIGQALRDGFAASRGDIVLAFDADLSYSVDHIGRMLEAFERDQATIVVASPYMDGGKTSSIPWRREQMSRQVNRLLAASSH